MAETDDELVDRLAKQHFVSPAAVQVVLYRRDGEGGAVVVALNLGAEPVSVASSSIGFGREILLSTFLDREGEQVRARSICAATRA
jgi:hypothetical protein